MNLHSTGCFAAGTAIAIPGGDKIPIEKKWGGLHIVSVGGGFTTITKDYKDKEAAVGTLFGINDGEPFASPTIPFFTPEGWKVVDPEAAKLENPYITYQGLQVGDTVYRIGKMDPLLYEPVKIKRFTFTTLSTPTKVYGLHLDGVQTFHANGYMVSSNNPIATSSRIQEAFMNLSKEEREGVLMALESSRRDMSKVMGNWYSRLYEDLEQVAAQEEEEDRPQE